MSPRRKYDFYKDRYAFRPLGPIGWFDILVYAGMIVFAIICLLDAIY